MDRNYKSKPGSFVLCADQVREIGETELHRLAAAYREMGHPLVWDTSTRWRVAENEWNLKSPPWSEAIAIEEVDDAWVVPGVVCWLTRGGDSEANAELIARAPEMAARIAELEAEVERRFNDKYDLLRRATHWLRGDYPKPNELRLSASWEHLPDVAAAAPEFPASALRFGSVAP